MSKKKGNRERIYEAEADLTSPNTTPEAMQIWLDWVVTTKWWKDRSKIKHVRVVFPFMGAWSGAYKEGPHLARIEFRVFNLDQITVCHELAHILTWEEGTSDEEDHGPRFAGMYIAVVGRFDGAKVARELMGFFDSHEVKYSILK